MSGLAVNCKSPLSENAAGQGRQKCAVVRRLPRAFLLEFVKNQSASASARPGQVLKYTRKGVTCGKSAFQISRVVLRITSRSRPLALLAGQPSAALLRSIAPGQSAP